MKRLVLSTTLLALLAAMSWPYAEGAGIQDVYDRVEHGYADSDGVQIHYVTLGDGPLVVMIHGFPDFWYMWRYQMEALSESYQVVAIDQRGYNRSDKPEGVEHYDITLLVSDVGAVIRDLGREEATIVGHDWGGFVAWNFAMAHPEMTKNLIIFNLPHPRGLMRELALNRQQKANSAYARRFQQAGAHESLDAEQLALRHQEDPIVHERYLEAFRRSDFEAMLNYYKANYPKPPYLEDTSPVVKVQPPVLQFHGLGDSALLHDMLNHTWEWLEQDLTLVTMPDAGHWAVTEKADFVTRMMKAWLTLQAARE